MSANKAETSLLPLLCFRLAQQAYGLAIANVVEVAAMLQLEALPDSAEALLGVANRHGEILPILDLRKAFKVEAAPITTDTFFIVTEAEKEKIGLVVDEIYQVQYFEQASFKLASGASRFISHLLSDGEKLYQQLNMQALLAAYLPKIHS